jgi:hypothetical protein
MNDATCYTGSPSFDAAVNAFMAHAQSVCDENSSGINAVRIVVDGPGQKYVRIVRAMVHGTSRSVYCFVDRANGDILFPKSWASPSKKTPRGNVYQRETYTCAGPYGVAYLRK